MENAPMSATADVAAAIRPLVNKDGLHEAYPSLTRRQIDNLVATKRIPFVKIQSRIFFDLNDIARWVDSQKVMSKE